ncbi:MAG TPA: ABC transporter permease [Gaiellaceae bacterium]|nr:ABC transporter permease [Gaiellaceae bacterium]
MTTQAEVVLASGRIKFRIARAAGIAAIALGVLAFWVALPPRTVRSEAVPVVLGLLGIALGLFSWRKGETRLGWTAAMIALLGMLGGVLAAHAAVENLKVVITWSAVIAATLRFATPLIFASIGGLFSERSGVVNIGLEGMMLMGAFFGVLGGDKTDSWVLGILIGMASGAALALVHAFFSIHLRSDQIVSGTAINFLALGITGYLYIDTYGQEGTGDLPAVPDVNLDWLSRIPPEGLGSFLEKSIGHLNLMVWLAFLTVVLAWVVIFRTTIGLRIRSVGEHPRAADTVGISVYATRYAAVVVSGALAALGGVYLSLGFVHSFTENMTAGRGFIALAALIFGKWRPFGALGAAMLFGFASAIAPRLQNVESWATYGTLFQALPYLLTLIAVAGVIGRSIPPAAIGRPYIKQ